MVSFARWAFEVAKAVKVVSYSIVVLFGHILTRKLLLLFIVCWLTWSWNRGRDWQLISLASNWSDQIRSGRIGLVLVASGSGSKRENRGGFGLGFPKLSPHSLQLYLLLAYAASLSILFSSRGNAKPIIIIIDGSLPLVVFRTRARTQTRSPSLS